MNQTHPTPDEIVDYLHGELSPSRDAAIHAHIAECAECAEARDAEVKITELLRAHARAQERELPSGVLASIRSKIAERPPSLWEQIVAGFRPAVAVPVAIAIAAFIYFGIKTAHRPAQAATIDAAYYVSSYDALSGWQPLSADEPVPQLTTNDEAP